MFPTPPALKILRIRRTVAMRLLQLHDTGLMPPTWVKKEDVAFILENRKMIEETNNKHYLFHAKVSV